MIGLLPFFHEVVGVGVGVGCPRRKLRCVKWGGGNLESLISVFFYFLQFGLWVACVPVLVFVSVGVVLVVHAATSNN